ncbi:hypothetical protein CVT26_002461 [Gymnopilus dilepis]|uniref:Uncharacterized protein n=1 Tax=Gymnopilus dilepis TaxID=231916 RepID=A0A409VT31_9AGAR|nr:hypothetical protein CVT26_002461 [Gymnopilus dilepis]
MVVTGDLQRSGVEATRCGVSGSIDLMEELRTGVETRSERRTQQLGEVEDKMRDLIVIVKESDGQRRSYAQDVNSALVHRPGGLEES